MFLFLLLFGCNTNPQIEADRKKFLPISVSRPLGSPCSLSDSSIDPANLKRRSQHPLGPTGGWSNTIEIDSARQPSKPSQGLTRRQSTLAGFLQFPTSGELRLRSYDDVYGAVYCGWSPAKAALPAAAKPVFVSLGTCAVGDGGLDQVHEVCWFPTGAPQGSLIYSSSHPDPHATASPADLYRPQDLGGEVHFNESVAVEAIQAAVQDANLSLVRRIVDDSLSALAGLRPLTDGATGQPILARDYYRGVWVRILAYQLLLSHARPGFSALKAQLQALLAAPSKYQCPACPAVSALLPRLRRAQASKVLDPLPRTAPISEFDSTLDKIFSLTEASQKAM